MKRKARKTRHWFKKQTIICFSISKICTMNQFPIYCWKGTAAAAAKSLLSCPTLCDPIDSSPPGSPIPGILQARTLEWVAISFSNVWKWKWSRSVMSNSSRPRGLQPTRLLRPWDFPGKSTGVGCHRLLLWLIHVNVWQKPLQYCKVISLQLK